MVRLLDTDGETSERLGNEYLAKACLIPAWAEISKDRRERSEGRLSGIAW